MQPNDRRLRIDFGEEELAAMKLWPAASEGRQVVNGIEYTTEALERCVDPKGSCA